MVQVLHLSNGETINPKLTDSKNRISRWLASGASDAEIVDRLFLVALSRTPSDQERDRLLEAIAEYGDDRRQAIEGTAWSVLTSTEFAFNHKARGCTAHPGDSAQSTCQVNVDLFSTCANLNNQIRRIGIRILKRNGQTLLTDCCVYFVATFRRKRNNRDFHFSARREEDTIAAI